MRYGLLGLLASLAAIYVISTQINLRDFGDAWSQARYIYVLPCVALLLGGLVMRALRWRVLLSDGLPLWRAFGIMNVAYLINGFIPLRAGEFARAYLASRADPPVPVFKSISTIIVERLLDLLAVVLMLAFALAAGPVPDWLRVTGISSGLMALSGFLFMVGLSRQRDVAHKLLGWTVARVPMIGRLRVEAWLDHFLDGLLPLAQTRTLGLALVWTAVSWGFSAAAGYVLMYTFYEQASWVATCLYIAAAAFAIAVPAVPGNVGTYEWAILMALSALNFGQDANVAAAFAVTVHAVNVGVHAATGVIGFVQEGVSLSQLSQGARRVSEANELGSI